MKLLTIFSILLVLTACADHSHFDSAPECKVSKEQGISKLTCNGETVEIRDGLDGLFVAIHDPCGPQTQFDEILLETRSGQFIAYFEVALSTQDRLVVLKENVNYTTTDGTGCKFRIENGVILD